MCFGVFIILNLWDVGIVCLFVMVGFEVFVMISVGYVFLKG